MAFITSTDYAAQIKADVLDRIIESDNSLLLDAENKSLAQAKSRLRVRFDVDTIFSTTGDSRHAELVMYIVDMTLYHLHSRINPGQVPELRKERYQDALDWLKGVAAGDYDPGLPGIGDADEDGTDDGNVMQSGSATPRNPYF